MEKDKNHLKKSHSYMQEYTLSFPIWVEFGSGSSEKLGDVADSKNWEKALIVTDEGVVNAGLLDVLQDSLESKSVDYSVYDGVEPNPTIKMVEEANQLLSDENCDFLVAVGGGSVMDVAKTTSMLATNPGSVSDYEFGPGLEAKEIENHPAPLVTVPTTAGTGSEVDYWAVITDTDREFKMCLGQAPQHPGGPYLGANVSLVDPELTKSLPPRQTAATGFDAFSHALENYVSLTRPAIVKPLVLHVIELVTEYLPVAYENGDDMEARENIMFGAHMAGICENFAGFGAIHSLAEVTGAMYPDIPHGEAIAVYTPAVMEYNRPAVPDRFRDVARAMGVDVNGLSDDEASKKAVEAVRNIMDEVDLPSSLSELGVEEDDLQTIAEKSMDTSEIGDNPREASAEDMLEIAKSVY